MIDNKMIKHARDTDMITFLESETGLRSLVRAAHIAAKSTQVLP